MNEIQLKLFNKSLDCAWNMDDFDIHPSSLPADCSYSHLQNALYRENLAAHTRGIAQYQKRFLELKSMSQELARLSDQVSKLWPSNHHLMSSDMDLTWEQFCHTQFLNDLKKAQKDYEERSLNLRVVYQFAQIKSALDECKADLRNLFNHLICFYARRDPSTAISLKTRAIIDVMHNTLGYLYRECQETYQELQIFTNNVTPYEELLTEDQKQVIMNITDLVAQDFNLVNHAYNSKIQALTRYKTSTNGFESGGCRFVLNTLEEFLSQLAENDQENTPEPIFQEALEVKLPERAFK